MIFAVAELLAIILLPLAAITQVIWPLFAGTPLFPALRRQRIEVVTPPPDVQRAIERLNREWFDVHRDLSTVEMLERGLIDRRDMAWVEHLRSEHAHQDL